MATEQVSTGVPGLDDVLSGGYLPGCPTLVMGQPGCGKTLLLLQFLADGAKQGHRAVCATCSEAPERMLAYMVALGHPAEAWVRDGRLVMVDLRPEPGEVVLGALDQEVVKIRLDAALAEGGVIAPEARLGIDDLNRLAYAFNPDGVARVQTLALLRLLRESGITTIMSAADDAATRAALIDYAVDAVIGLRQTVAARLMTRTLRVLKMRGVPHGTNEYPFMIDSHGPSLLPPARGMGGHRSREGLVSTGHERLDTLLGGGLYRGGSVMVSGTSGTGKTTLLGQIAQGLCTDGRRVIYVTLEQDQSELIHDFKGVGIDVEPHRATGRLRFHRARSVDCSLEEHLIRIVRLAEAEAPDAIFVDAVTSFADLDSVAAVKSMVLRLIDACKSRGVMVVLTELLADAAGMASSLGLSSMLDAWIRLELHRQTSEYVRLIRVLKGRGVRTSQQIKEFQITSAGIAIDDPYLGGGAFVFGTEKLIREREDHRERIALERRLEQLRRELEVLPQAYDARVDQTVLERDKAIESLREEIETLRTRLAASKSSEEAVREARGQP
ncbi:AAA family ATPase [Roseospira marina]|uniref:non-specific serine/threonine protein kinase n=1 Tax=Roseospira marina TaxID=140057 RepID=A0A5M6IFR1_9PROT|nr:ATPase domain-containing protein [Roseospira marina]KAA5607130.1 AAA family ATPase [Roseospira marina]MBB4312670.1 circadian clock protein KaiC [Roseospira marina]MBB5086557.1 circadian clock protein KaiC [Roseospira marina]